MVMQSCKQTREIDAEEFANWVISNERVLERHARSGHHTLSPVVLFVNAQLGGRIVRYHREVNAIAIEGDLYAAPDWVAAFEDNLTWRAGGKDRPVGVDQILEALAAALWFECVKATVRRRQRRS
jgi:hypothetical protein